MLVNLYDHDNLNTIIEKAEVLKVLIDELCGCLYDSPLHKEHMIAIFSMVNSMLSLGAATSSFIEADDMNRNITDALNDQGITLNINYKPDTPCH